MTEQDLRLNWEWLAAPTVRSPDLRATWARLEIGIGSQSITLVEEAESGSSRRSIFVSLYPLAEWIAFNWWFLRAHTRPATALSLFRALGRGAHHHQRHAVRAAADGFLWPNLFIVPEGRTTRLFWKADRPTGAEENVVRFISAGSVSIDSDAVIHKLESFVESVLLRLDEQDVRDTPLASEWAAIRDADPEETEFCLAAARLGLDPYADAATYEQAILDAAHQLTDEELLGDFLDVVEPTQIPSALAWLVAGQAEIDKLTDRPARSISDLPITVTNDIGNSLRPWQSGWEQARLVRAALDMAPDQIFNVEEWMATAVGRTLSVDGLQALGRNEASEPPRLVLNRRASTTSKRFTIARALSRALRPESLDFLITSAHTDRQKTERAFAAELLAPAAGISSLLKQDEGLYGQLGEGTIEELAAHFKVSPLVVEHQIENQILASA